MTWTSSKQKRIGCSFKAAILLLLVFGFHETARPAEYHRQIKFKRLRLENGLPNNVTHNVVQDKQGFLWFMTFNGLARYDAYTMRIFKHRPDTPDSLPGNFVWNGLCERSGSIWLSCWGAGASLFDPRTETFANFTHDPNDDTSISSNNIWAFVEDNKGRVWIATEKGLDRFDRDTRTFSRFKPNFLKSHVVDAMMADRDGYIWLGTMGDGVWQLNPDTETFKTYTLRDTKIDPSVLSTVWGFCQGHDGTIWIGGNAAIGSIPPGGNEIRINHVETRDADVGAFITPYSEIFPNELWVGGTLGLDVLNMKNGVFETIHADSARTDQISSSRIWSIFKSRGGGNWITTSNGVDYFFPDVNIYRHIYRIPGSKNTLSGNSVTALYEDAEGYIWIGTERGLDRFNPKSGRLENLKPKWNDAPQNDVVRITDITSDPHGNIWITSVLGALKINPATERQVTYSMQSPPEYRIDRNLLVGADVDPKGNVWLLSKAGGLTRVDAATGKSRQIIPSLVPGESFGWPISIKIDRAGIMWVAMDEGLSRYDPATNLKAIVSRTDGGTKSFKGSSVLAVMQDRHGRLWMGTNQGLIEIDDKGNPVRLVGTQEGLPSNLVYAVGEDDSGRLWLGTDKGIASYNSASGRVKLLNDSLNIQEQQFSSNAVLRAQNGAMYFGCNNGLIFFQPSRIKPKKYTSRVWLTHFTIMNDQSSREKDGSQITGISYKKKVVLSYFQHHFNVTFSALDYRAPDKTRYAYKLEGLDGDWIYADANNRKAAYTNLDPGKYTFRVKAADVSGNWSPNEAALKIQVLPPWWLKWWFKTLCAFALLLAFGLFYIWRTRKYRLQTVALENAVKKRTEDLRQSEDQYRKLYLAAEAEKQRAEKALEAELTAIRQNLNFVDMISHEYRTPLSVLSSSLDLLERMYNMDEHPELWEQLAAMRSSTRRLVDVFEKSLDQKRVDDSNISAQKSLVNVSETAGKVIDFTHCAYPDHRLQFEDAFEGEPLVYADRELLVTAISNILDNACKYSPRGSNVSVRIFKEAGYAVVEIQDNGCGIRKKEIPHIFQKYYRSENVGHFPGAGLGLFLVKRIIDLMDGRLLVSSKEWVGTTVTLKLPCEANVEEKT